jgi:hypothetical protein
MPPRQGPPCAHKAEMDAAKIERLERRATSFVEPM